MSSHKTVKLGPHVSARQRELLVAFMEGHPFLVRAACALDREVTAVRKQALWSELAALLNAEGPAVKTAEQWQGYWRKEIFLSRKDAATASASQSGTGGGHLPGLRGRIIQLVGTSTATGRSTRVSDRETLLQRVADDYARSVAQSAETNELLRGILCGVDHLAAAVERQSQQLAETLQPVGQLSQLLGLLMQQAVAARQQQQH
ncbi:hypothetical protein HPB49_004013 [Dermacentor silvarum]|uniref:Uncharacterized protein n=1 Tax=Dermacentor silvarum TaxID=543639 RepID=A0ACB8DMU0_DERSI|nr:hypothetical protein HPB49_004013 [Dermacentor silvarum]